ncbi:MAG: hypothetical protein KME64_30735 [Scytonematopsis contorta HA4267-MV1]|jgi:hypothetical protein|nr:hypothetical protein [Scytonematopsis contorta HA4267-MV1]
MFNRLLLIFGSVLASGVISAQSALAQSAEIEFSGVVPEQTSIIIPNVNNTSTITSANSAKKVKTSWMIDSRSLTFNSSRPVSVMISTPQLVSGGDRHMVSDSKRTVNKTLLNSSSGDASIVIGSQAVTLDAGISNFQLETSVQSPQNFLPGSYNYAVTVTVVPQ